ncbi:diguanylate cyclase (GGDEF)-like protein [Kineococcus xinjiangensis]|uniref:Diguanylate cyclase (GGDEF)-like protein n=1 Tax=Kineococcus xinjiangensis TaxID=512762 RepID=A0A2S6IWC1_9ACTN|nr:bifunctional diguanylate cyclase/phosphodiesterase [Kineococcus xinjiangensis]PPK98576.1 diguanylate cyclase (GGDEF)-like protein [Kineococcus xinjiangensis]
MSESATAAGRVSRPGRAGRAPALLCAVAALTAALALLPLPVSAPLLAAQLLAFAALAVKLRERRRQGRRADRGVWPALVAAAALAITAEVGGSAHRGALPVSLTMTAAFLLVSHSQLQLLRQRVRSLAGAARLDIAASTTSASAIAVALLMPRLQESTDLPAGAVLALLVAAVAGVAVLLQATACAVLTARAPDRRILLVGGGALLLLVPDAVDVHLLATGPGAVLPTAVHGAATALALAAWAVASRMPRPAPAPRLDESAGAVAIGPALIVPLCLALLWWDHVRALPTQAVALALATLVLLSLKATTVVHRLAQLNSTRRQALTDPLTHLGNRRALTARLHELEGGDEPFSLSLVDLDGFREVNDTLGHEAGDELLRQVAARLREGCGADDLVVRQGGDEFALLSPGSTLEAATERAQRLHDLLRVPYLLEGKRVHVGGSLGVTASPGRGPVADVLLRQADAALHAAQAGGGGAVAYSAELDEARQRAAETVAQLLDAVGSPRRRGGPGPGGRIVAHYQPQMDPLTGAVVGAEALVRWEHPTRGVLAPFHFLAAAEEHGLMPALTELMLEDALTRVKQWRELGCDRISVNVSATCLRDDRLVATVRAGLLRHGVPASSLVLEITETEIIEDLATSKRVLAELVELGVGVSIDDYGTGYSSLAHLRDLPVEELKLDRSFTAELVTDARTRAIVRTTVDMAHSLGLRLVAEGVEDARTLEVLRLLGVDQTQGYFHSRPVPPAELSAWLRENAAARPRVH